MKIAWRPGEYEVRLQDGPRTWERWRLERGPYGWAAEYLGVTVLPVNILALLPALGYEPDGLSPHSSMRAVRKMLMETE